MLNTFSIGVPGARICINKVNHFALMEDVRERFRSGTGFALATLNVDHLVKLRKSAAFRAAYKRHDLIVADGNPIVWLSRLASKPVSLVAGADLVEPLAALAAEEDIPVAFLGATSETLALAAAELTKRNPLLRVVARLAPGNAFDPHGAEADEMIAALARSGARLAFLALGAPRQEVFAARCRDVLPDIGFASVGAGLDFIAASKRRAPAWMRRVALEWLWRVMQEPRRLTMRYALCAMTLPGLALSVLTSGRA